MTTNNEQHTIVRYLEGEELEYGLPCWVGHSKHLEPCKRPSTVRVYGIPLCPEHGEEAICGTLEEMHQGAYEFFGSIAREAVELFTNPWVRRAVKGWRLTVPTEQFVSPERDEAALLTAYPFRADKVDPEMAYEIANPDLANAYPLSIFRKARHDIHMMMRLAYERGIDWLIETLEPERESVSAQLAYLVVLSRRELAKDSS